MPRRKQTCPKRMKYGEDGEEIPEDCIQNGDAQEEEVESGDDSEQEVDDDQELFHKPPSPEKSEPLEIPLPASDLSSQKKESVDILDPESVKQGTELDKTEDNLLQNAHSPNKGELNYTDVAEKYMPPGIETPSKNGLESLTCVLNNLLDKSQSPLSSVQEHLLPTEVLEPKKKPLTFSSKASDLLKMFNTSSCTTSSPKKLQNVEETNLQQDISREDRKNKSEGNMKKSNVDEPLDLSIKQEENVCKDGSTLDGALDLSKRPSTTSSTSSISSDEPVSFLQKLEEKFGSTGDEKDTLPKKNHKHHTLPSFSTNVFTAALYNMKPMATTDLVYRKDLKQNSVPSSEPKGKSPRNGQDTQDSPNNFIDKSMKILQRRSTDVDKLIPPKLTTFVCECKKEYDTLYNLTIHIQETNHMPKKHRTITGEYPKLVRGQDMWLTQGSEQTRQILRCMQCGESFKSLPELTVHMMQTKHYAKIMNTDSQRPTRPLSPTLSDDVMGDTMSPVNYEETLHSSDKPVLSFGDHDWNQKVQQRDSSPEYGQISRRYSPEIQSFPHNTERKTPESESVSIRCDKCGKNVLSDLFTEHVQQCVKSEIRGYSSASPPALIPMSSTDYMSPERNSSVPVNSKPSFSVNSYLNLEDKEPTASHSAPSALAAMEKFVTQRFDANTEKESKRPTLSDAISSFPLNSTFQFPRVNQPDSPRSEKLRSYINNMFSTLPTSKSTSLSKEERSTIPVSTLASQTETPGPLNLCLPKYMESRPMVSPIKPFVTNISPSSMPNTPNKTSTVTTQSDIYKSAKEQEKVDISENLDNGHDKSDNVDRNVSAGEKYLGVKEEEENSEPVVKKADGSALESLKGMVYGHSFTTEHPLDSLQKLIHDSVQQRSSMPLPDSPLVRNNSVSPYSQSGPSTFILVNPIVTVVSPSGMQVAQSNKTTNADSDEISTLKANVQKLDKKENVNHEEKENNNILCKNCGKTYSNMSYRYHTTWCNIASTQIQQKLELKEALHFSPYIYMPLDHTSGTSPQKSQKSPAQSPQSAESPSKRIKKDPDCSSPVSKFHKYYQMADELAKKK